MPIIRNITTAIIALATLVMSIFKPNVSTSMKSVASLPQNPMSIEYMRQQTYPGSLITIEETLAHESNYNRYIVSYTSDGLKNYALLLVPTGQKPVGGWPVIILNHGYIIPERYTPDGNYIAYADALASAGYIVFKPNYRGNGKSEGSPTSTYFSPDYIIDDLNAIASIKKYPDANPDKIGVWGHSMGGFITLKDIVVNTKDIKAAVIWGGVVGTYNDIIYNWQNRVSYKPNAEDLRLRNQNLNLFLKTYGTPAQNPSFWDSIDPASFLKDVTAPVQIDVGLADTQVPPDFSTGLYQRLKLAGKVVEYYEYPGANHDINQSFTLAMQRTIDFFNLYLK
jgi:dipeptidyl aminopeptidase/acylaminoacyl peptidase